MEHMEHMEQMVIMVARDVRGGEMWGACRCVDGGLTMWQLSEGRNERRAEVSRGRMGAHRRAEARGGVRGRMKPCRMKNGPKLVFRTVLRFALGGSARYGILPACVHGSSKARW